MSNERIFFYYDPQRQGFDTLLWKTITGTPAISGNNLRLNNASMIHYGDIFKADVEFELIVPTAPTAGDVREFGFMQLNHGGKVTFKISGTDFTAEVDNGKGVTNSTVLTWDTDWNATATRFKIVWVGFEAAFFINDIRVALDRTDGVPKEALSVYVKNGTADNMDLVFAQVKNVHNLI